MCSLWSGERVGCPRAETKSLPAHFHLSIQYINHSFHVTLFYGDYDIYFLFSCISPPNSFLYSNEIKVVGFCNFDSLGLPLVCLLSNC